MKTILSLLLALVPFVSFAQPVIRNPITTNRFMIGVPSNGQVPAWNSAAGRYSNTTISASSSAQVWTNDPLAMAIYPTDYGTSNSLVIGTNLYTRPVVSLGELPPNDYFDGIWYTDYDSHSNAPVYAQLWIEYFNDLTGFAVPEANEILLFEGSEGFQGMGSAGLVVVNSLPAPNQPNGESGIYPGGSVSSSRAILGSASHGVQNAKQDGVGITGVGSGQIGRLWGVVGRAYGASGGVAVTNIGVSGTARPASRAVGGYFETPTGDAPAIPLFENSVITADTRDSGFPIFLGKSNLVTVFSVSTDGAIGTSSKLTIGATTNHITFGATNAPPVSAIAPTHWISVLINGSATQYKIPLYQ